MGEENGGARKHRRRGNSVHLRTNRYQILAEIHIPSRYRDPMARRPRKIPRPNRETRKIPSPRPLNPHRLHTPRRRNPNQSMRHRKNQRKPNPPQHHIRPHATQMGTHHTKLKPKEPTTMKNRRTRNHHRHTRTHHWNNPHHPMQHLHLGTHRTHQHRKRPNHPRRTTRSTPKIRQTPPAETPTTTNTHRAR